MVERASNADKGNITIRLVLYVQKQLVLLSVDDVCVMTLNPRKDAL